MTVNANLYAHFQDRFPADPDSLLLRTAQGEALSYAQADAGAARLADALLRSGASPGDRVTVQVHKSPENLLLYLACLRAGLIYHPLNTAYTASELAYFINDAQPSIVVCDESALNTFSQLLHKEAATTQAIEVLTLNADGSGTLMQRVAELPEPPDDAEVYNADGSETAALLYSSGTTGQPKGIMLTHDNLSKNVETLVDIWGFTPSDCLLHALPIYHVHGLFVGVGCVLMSGASMIWHSRFDAEEVLAALPNCTVMMGVPTFYTRLLSKPEFSAGACASMRLFVSGSAPLHADTFAEFANRTGHRILERYGMTETGMNSSNPLHGERLAGTVGPALPGVTLRVVDEAGEEVAVGDTGVLQVRGPNVFPGYWRNPEKTAEDLSEDGFFTTGDLACINAAGYLSIVGRAKDMIISGGLNIYPKEIEAVIDELPMVLESAVIGVPDADFGESVMAVVVPADAEVDEASVLSHCRSKLAAFKAPKHIEILDTLPRNAMGKVQKKVLRERYASAS